MSEQTIYGIGSLVMGVIILVGLFLFVRWDTEMEKGRVERNKDNPYYEPSEGTGCVVLLLFAIGVVFVLFGLANLLGLIEYIP